MPFCRNSHSPKAASVARATPAASKAVLRAAMSGSREISNSLGTQATSHREALACPAPERARSAPAIRKPHSDDIEPRSAPPSYSLLRSPCHTGAPRGIRLPGNDSHRPRNFRPMEAVSRLFSMLTAILVLRCQVFMSPFLHVTSPCCPPYHSSCWR